MANLETKRPDGDISTPVPHVPTFTQSASGGLSAAGRRVIEKEFPEIDRDYQAFLEENEIDAATNPETIKKDLALKSAIQMMLLGNQTRETQERVAQDKLSAESFLAGLAFDRKTYDQLQKQDVITPGDLLSVDPKDQRAMAMDLYPNGDGTYTTGESLARRNINPAEYAQGHGKPINLARARGEVIGAITEASHMIGVNTNYMLRMAQRESKFVSNADNPTSSARGLYQFLDATWAGMQRQYGARYGLSGVSRDDPRASSIMGALFARDNGNFLERRFPHREITQTDLYLAHFMGPAGAAKFIRLMEVNPHANAAAAFGTEASANRSVFGNKTMLQFYNDMRREFGSDSWKAAAPSQPRLANNNSGPSLGLG